MACVKLQCFRADVTRKLHQLGVVSDMLGKIEDIAGIDRLFVVIGAVGIFQLYMIFGHFAELICNIIGFLYPAYLSMKAIESSSKVDDTQWLMYWVIFALFSVVEFAEETILELFPFYWLCKCVFLLYLYLPKAMGAQMLYARFVRPHFIKFEVYVDEMLEKMLPKVVDDPKEGAGDSHQ